MILVGNKSDLEQERTVSYQWQMQIKHELTHALLRLPQDAPVDK